MTQVVICTKISSDLMKRFDALATPRRSAVLRELIEEYVNEKSPPPMVAVEDGPCPHEGEWARLATGLYCPQCRERME